MSTKSLEIPGGSSSAKSASVVSISHPKRNVEMLTQHYGCGTLKFAGAQNALYERHLVFDNALDPSASDQRMQFEAFARSVRDILSQRWILTEQTYLRENPK